MKVLELLAEKWQKLLQMKDWEIVFSIVDKEAMKKAVGKVVEGGVKYDLFKYTATVLILSSVPESKYEEIIIHEFLHLVFAWETRHYADVVVEIGNDEVALLLSELRTDAVERILHQITSALMKERV